MTDQPLISCIMPTYNRRRFVPQAIRYFQRQNYPNRELIVVDDGSDAIQDLIPEDSRIRYVRLERKRSIGEKRNIGCQEARGDIIAHWDDDDWIAPWRLCYQIECLQREVASICGLDKLLFFDPKDKQVWQYVYPAGGKPWVAGGTMCYRKSLWEANRFSDVDNGEDTHFVWNLRGERVLALPNTEFYVALLHGQNTSAKVRNGSRWTDWPGDIAQILGEDLHFYRSNDSTPTSKGTSGMKLNLGCCDALLPDHVNVDIVAAPGVEVVDLRETWPWPEGSVERVRAWDIIEHLPDKMLTMNELWRVLEPGGIADIAVPTTDGSGAWQDPTHVSFWNRRSFLYYEAGNPYRERFAKSYGIQAKFRTVQERIDQTPDGPRLSIVLEAVKP